MVLVRSGVQRGDGSVRAGSRGWSGQRGGRRTSARRCWSSSAARPTPPSAARWPAAKPPASSASASAEASVRAACVAPALALEARTAVVRSSNGVGVRQESASAARRRAREKTQKRKQRTLLCKQPVEVARRLSKRAPVHLRHAIDPLLPLLKHLDRPPLHLQLPRDLLKPPGKRQPELLSRQKLDRRLLQLCRQRREPVGQDDVPGFGLVELGRVQLGVLGQLGVVVRRDVDAVLLARGLPGEGGGEEGRQRQGEGRRTAEQGEGGSRTRRTSRSFLRPSISATYSLMSPFLVILRLTSGRLRILVARVA